MTQYKVFAVYEVTPYMNVRETNTVSTIDKALTWLVSIDRGRQSQMGGGTLIEFGYCPIEIEEDPDFEYDREEHLRQRYERD